MKRFLFFLTTMSVLLPACVSTPKPELEATVQAAVASTKEMTT